MKRVLFLMPTLHGGGAERVILTLVRHLDRSRFRPVLAIVDARKAAYMEEVAPDVEMHDLGCTRVRYALVRIARLIWKTRPDVVFSTLGHLNLALAFLRPLLPSGILYVARETTLVTMNLCSSGWPKFWRWSYRSFYQRFDAVVCQSISMRDDLVNCLNFPAIKATVIHNPVDVVRIQALSKHWVSGDLDWPRAKTDASSIRLLAVGRLELEKGFDLLIEAISLCADPRLVLVILGEGSLRAELGSLARARGVESRVQFAGFQRNPYPFFARADAFVLSSRYEGFPNVVLEALACGTPVIATPAPGGTREILDSVPECRVAADVSAASLAAAISSWCVEPTGPVPLIRLQPYALQRIVYRYQALFANGVG